MSTDDATRDRGGIRPWVTALLALTATAACGDTYHVWSGSATNGPGTAWANAFWTIQGAVDAATNAGDVVLVTNGVYDTGGAVTPGYALSNRVCITSTITVQSVNGPGGTLIVGAGPNGGSAMRCVYMTNGPTLAGFTLTNGHTRTSGDIICDQSGGGVLATDGAVSNCIITASSAYTYGGGSGLGSLNTCLLSGNAARHGGGCYLGTLNNCTLSSNSATTYGGGGFCQNGGTLSNCTLSGNSAGYSGGGTYYGTLNNCALSGNSAQYGGGTDSGNLSRCTLSGNSASRLGGGSYYGELNNCAIWGNSAYQGGGSYNGTLMNCTLSGNSADTDGGHYGGGLYNCISYYNKARLGGDNGSSGGFYFCCTTPDPGGTGIITNAPMLLNGAHIHASSPCVAAGSASYASGVDIDGDAWANPPALGCDQPVGPYAGALTVSIEAPQTNIAVGYSLGLHAVIGGKPSSNSWAFGDGDSRANSAYVSKSWSQTGVFTVACSAYHNDNPGGVSATTSIHVVATPVLHVWTNSPDPNPPYADWQHAAHTIQQAVDASAEVWGSLVVVTDGVYRAGGRVMPGYALSNRVAITHPVTVESVHGASSTLIVGESHPVTTNGNAAMRCLYMANGGHLHGFTLTNGHTRTSGDSIHDRSGGGALAGGVLSDCLIYGNSANDYGGGNCYGTLNDCELSGNAASYNGGGSYDGTLNNCALTGNAATDGGGSYLGVLNNCTLSGNAATANGGGSYRGTLNNCAIAGNAAQGNGGGSYLGVLYNCTLSDNAAAVQGGGIFGAVLRNCIVYYNTAPTATSNYVSATFLHSCTAPLPGGTGNIAAPPQFLDRGAADYRLAHGSPCIDSGSNTYAFGTDDLDGLTRITDGNADGTSIVDMGAYEYDRSIYDTDGDGLCDGAELDTHGTDPLNPNTDGDPHSDGKEVTICDTDPNDPTSYFHILKIEATAHGIFDITLPCSTARSYYVEWGTNLLDWAIVPGMTQIPGDSSGYLSLTVTNEIGKAFFRGGVSAP